MNATIFRSKKLPSFIVLLTVVMLFACKKENSTSAIDTQEFAAIAAGSDAEAETTFDDVFDNVMGVSPELGIGGTGIFGTAHFQSDMSQEIPSSTQNLDSNRCFTTTFTLLNAPNPFPLQVTIDFGTGCVSKEGRTRSGKIITVYTGPLFIPGNSSTTTFVNYSINGTKVEGTHKTINQSTSAARVFAVTVTGGKLTRPNGNIIAWNSSKTISQTDGLGTPQFPLDDIFRIEGETTGSNTREGQQIDWSTTITQPLIKKFSCRWIVQGVVKMQKGADRIAELNYGDGTCDNKATITAQGVTREITLQ